MSDSLYIDQYNRVWHRPVTPVNGAQWLLTTTSSAFTIDLFEVGSYYTDEQLSKNKVALHKLVKGSSYALPPHYKSGDEVWVDMVWLYDAGVDSMLDYTGSPARIGGIVEEVNDPTTLDIIVTVRVPRSKVTKR